MTERVVIGKCGNVLTVGDKVAYKCYSAMRIGWVHSFTPKKVRVSSSSKLDNVYHVQYEYDIVKVYDGEPDQLAVVTKERDEMKAFIEAQMDKVIESL